MNDGKPNDANAKQQITDRIKNVTNILVTVSNNPSVDELSAALGLTLMLNKFDKHATAVFSGTIPPAITFLDPSKTFENTVDSLRDFIIALDKEKADRLRYRVEDDVVRIFITPYRTRISEDDLNFTHGDFNVELVLALGVENKEVLDSAIAAHGRILHDATVATINAQNKTSDLGSLAWQDPSASSLCEMLVAMSESLQSGLLDEQISTAFLTGIVAATNRFSNKQTSPKSMTMAAQLMAAGANQQLIAAKLEETSAISVPAKVQPDGSTELTDGSSKKVREKPPVETIEDIEKKQKSLGEMKVEHGGQTPPPTEPAAPAKAPFAPSATIEQHEERNRKVAGEEALTAALEKLGSAGPARPSINDELKQAALPSIDDVANLAKTQEQQHSEAKSWRDQALAEPSMGGQLNATTEEAAEEKRREEQSSLNRVIMDHNSAPAAPPKGKTLAPLAHNEPHLPSVAPVGSMADIEKSLNTSAPQPQAASPAPNPVPAPLQPIFSAPSPSVLPPPPQLPDFSNPSLLPPLPPNGSSALPPLDANGLPIPGSPAAPPVAPQASPAAPPSNEPGQFKIPGQ